MKINMIMKYRQKWMLGILLVGLSSVWTQYVVANNGLKKSTSTVKVITAQGANTFNVQLALTPEQWEKAPILRGEKGGKKNAWGNIAKYPYPRYVGFNHQLGQASVDVLFLNVEGQVVGVFENIGDGGFHGYAKEAIAVFYLPAGAVQEYGISKGNLLIPGGFGFAPTVQMPKQKDADGKRKLEKELIGEAKSRLCSKLELGEFYLETKAYDLAVKIYQRALKDTPVDLSAQMGLAIAFAGAGKVEQAIEQFVKVIETDGTKVEAYLHLALIFRYAKKVTAIFTVLANGIARYPKLLPLRLELAKLYIQAGKNKDAKLLLDKAPIIDKTQEAKIARIKGDILLREGEMSQASAQYVKYLTVYPSAPHAAELRLFIARHQESQK